jgi:prepilin-type processing-associated H-X9-DG protein
VHAVPGREKRSADRGVLRALARLAVGGAAVLVLLALFLPAVRTSRGAARRAQCVNNLKLIGLAMRNYHEVYGRYPPAAIVDGDGRPLLSWRVAILPFIDNNALYAKFRLDEPWDGPHNVALLGAMHAVYACPGDTTPDSGMTNYRAVVGPRTPFPADSRPVSEADLTDGLDRTLLVAEARQAVPWTKPDEVPFDAAATSGGFRTPDGAHAGGVNALFADGTVRFIKSRIAPRVLRALLTRDGGETVSSDEF